MAKFRNAAKPVLFALAVCLCIVGAMSSSARTEAVAAQPVAAEPIICDNTPVVCFTAWVMQDGVLVGTSVPGEERDISTN